MAVQSTQQWDREEQVGVQWLNATHAIVVSVCIRRGRPFAWLRMHEVRHGRSLQPARQELVLPLSDAAPINAMLHRAELLARSMTDSPQQEEGPATRAHRPATEAKQVREVEAGKGGPGS